MKKNKKVIVLFILGFIILLSIVGVKIYYDFFNKEVPNEKISSIGLYGYTLTKNDSELYKSNFKALEDVLNDKSINYQEYAKLISKLFVIDVFSLDNKLSSTDIGGLEFIHNDLKENFKENMGSTLYNFIESNLDGSREQELPKVKSVVIDNVFETKYIYNDKEYKSYLVSLSWDYEKDLDYQNKIKLTIINDNNILYIVKGE